MLFFFVNEQEGRYTHTHTHIFAGKEHSLELKLSHILLHSHEERKKGRKGGGNVGMVERKKKKNTERERFGSPLITSWLGIM